MTSQQQFISTQQDEVSNSALDGERIVISGMSGLYPEAHSVKELSDILYNKVNPINSENRRWVEKHSELVEYMGKAPELDCFDAQFFKVHRHLGVMMDVMSRKILEQAYQAVYDAGIPWQHLDGKKVAVYVGVSGSDSEHIAYCSSVSKTGFGVTGCSRSMFANRISYWFNTKGPSLTIDEACCSSMAALEQAYTAIARGDCEAAIVGGAHINLRPQSSVHYSRLVPMAKDGKTKSFDQNADGCVKSDAVNVIFLQKAKDALRIYAELLYVKSEFVSVTNDLIPQFGLYRDPTVTTDFIKRFFEGAHVSPETVEFVEAFGSATPEADKSELEAISEVYCGENRSDPLLVGSVMSNVGCSQGAAGITAITKVLLGYHKGLLAGNLHCASPRQDVRALREGRLRVLTDHHSFRRTYAAVNAFSVTGVNAHVLLKGNYKPKDPSRYISTLPRLVTISGRQESSVKIIFDDLKSRPIDPEELALFHNLHSVNTPGHLGRGYIILDSKDQETVCLSEKIHHFDYIKRPLWFVYSGMGSQWAGMGAQLMRIPIFAAAIEKCRKILEPKGVDIVDIITTPDETIFDNILNSFLGIAAIQIGLTDVLRDLGLVPEKIIGHSVGELGCAYADGCMTAEEIITSAYCRGLVSLESSLIRGSMAAVGLGFKQIVKICPPEIDVACHNGPESSTISGPADVMREFVAELTAKGIFAKEVPCSNIAYHSRYIAKAGPTLLQKLASVIKNPRLRSERWLSTSISQERWNEPLAKYCSAEYHTNNLLSPVLFEEVCRLVPHNAVLVEVAPHGLLQAILKRSLPASCFNIGLVRRGHTDNALLLLEGVGKLYMEGYNPKVPVLYPKVEFPVSTETPLLSHLVEWYHVDKWPVLTVSDTKTITSAICKFPITIHDDEHSYLQGNVIRGKVLYPFAGAIVATWDTLAMHLGVRKRELPVTFHNVYLYMQPILHDQRQVKLNVAIHKGTGRFEIMNEDLKVATGYIMTAAIFDSKLKKYYDENAVMELNSHDIYHMLQERDYNYSGDFCSIASANESLTKAGLVWRNNWVTLIDGMLQFSTLRRAHDGFSQPTHIRRLSIDTKFHTNHTFIKDGKKLLICDISEIQDYTRCGGILLENIKFRDIPVEKSPLLLSIPSSVLSNINNDNQHDLRQNNSVDSYLTLQIGRIGDFSSLNWAESTEATGVGITVAVHYAGLNTCDVKRASGMFLHDINTNCYGMDFSGKTESGDRVMGIVGGGACSSRVRAQPELLWPVPAHWSLEDAATVPLAYAHAFYCLGIKAELRPGTRVLVHGGAGALGQASIAIALAYGCQVFTTVSDTQKKHLLRKLYPELKDEYIGNSRDSSFGDMVLSATGGHGCEYVISSVKGALKNVSLKCSAVSGTTLDTLQIQNKEEYEYGLHYMTKDRSYRALDFSSVFDEKNCEDMKTLQVMVSDGIARGYVRPLSRVTYAPHEAPRAFRLLAESQHCGRVLLRLHDSLPLAQTRISCSPHLCHLLICNGDTAEILVADRLVLRGVRKLHIHCPASSSYIRYKMRSWISLGVDVNLSTGKLNDFKDVLNLLNESIRMGPIEGIYTIITKSLDSETSDEVKNMLNYIDLESRKLCPLLKYFAVLSTNANDTIVLQTRLSRVRNGLPVTELQLLHCGKNMDDESVGGSINMSGAWYRDAIDALEVALRSTHPLLVAQRRHAQPTSMLHQLSTIADIAALNDAADNITLQELGMENYKTEIISAFLRDTYSIFVTDEEIPRLTKEKIRDLDLTANGAEFCETNGMKTFFSYIEPDGVSYSDIVLLPTLANNITESDELDVSETYLCIVPGLEGNHERFRMMCERLKLPALVLQPRLDGLHETIQETALRYSKILLNKNVVKNNFYLMGYESGVLVALELAALLEGNGMTGTIFCFGCAPDEFKVLLEEHLKDFETEERLQDAIIRHMFTLMAGEDMPELENALRGVSSWRQKVDACVRCLLGRVPHSAQYARALIEAAFARIVQARSYEAAPPAPLRSQLVLLRAAALRAPHAALAAPPALQAYSRRPVLVYDLAVPLAHATKDLRCAAIINRHLSVHILHEFESKNLCETYVLGSSLA